MKILAIDTATELCSAALLTDGVIVAHELETERGHAEHILSMVDQVLAEGGCALQALDAIAFGRGPGAFTGVRLAASVAQGLAFGADLPVAPVSDLAAVAQRAFDLDSEAVRLLVCNDARMQEVYWACFERSAHGMAVAASNERVGPAARVQTPSLWSEIPDGAGRGFRIYPELGQWVRRAQDTLLPRAAEIARLAVGAARVAPEQAIPVYLRDDVARPAS